jgi:hypothetical protein
VQRVQTFSINRHTQQVVASALLDMHSSLARDLQAQTQILADLIDQRHGYEGAIGGILDRSLDFAVTQEDAKVYLDVQQGEAKLHKLIAKELVESLHYETIMERYEGVIHAHQRTFEWIFQSQCTEDESCWSDFVQWLRQGDGIYWISGKAGSGKSTLMKYIYESPNTQKHLLAWTKDTPLHIGRFFFWLSGTKLQKSQEGLLRSLLYDVLRQVPALVRIVLPSQWASRYAEKTDLSKIRPVSKKSRLPPILLLT